MASLELFSKRQKRLRGEVSDVYSYDSIPQSLRVQIIYILRESLGAEQDYYNKNVEALYKIIVDSLGREYGVFQLTAFPTFAERIYITEIFDFILNEKNTEKVLDAVELAFRAVDKCTRDYEYRRLDNSDEVATESIKELNSRFEEHAVGFQFEEGEIIRVDSVLIHKEVVLPVLRLLNDSAYQGAQEEFLKAHEHYRHGNSKEAMNECLKSFESIMKAICDKRGWSYSSGDTALKLVEICLKNDLLPSFWQNKMNALRSLLESGVPTGRNKLSGHGQGSLPITVPKYIVAYVLHMTASCIYFLAEAEKALPE